MSKENISVNGIKIIKFAEIDIIDSLINITRKSDKSMEIKVSFEAITADTGEFIAYGPPVWIKIPKNE